MSLEVYTAIGALVAAYFGFYDYERGDYPRVTAAVALCVVWPITAAFGFGMMLHAIWRGAKAAHRSLSA